MNGRGETLANVDGAFVLLAEWRPADGSPLAQAVERVRQFSIDGAVAVGRHVRELAREAEQTRLQLQTAVLPPDDRRDMQRHHDDLVRQLREARAEAGFIRSEAAAAATDLARKAATLARYRRLNEQRAALARRMDQRPGYQVFGSHQSEMDRLMRDLAAARDDVAHLIGHGDF